MDSMKDTENTTQDLYHCDFKKLTVIQFKFNGTNISSNEDVQNIVKKYKDSLITKQPLVYHQPFEIITLNFTKHDVITMSPRYPNQVPEKVTEELCRIIRDIIVKEDEPIVITTYEFDFSLFTP